MRARHDYEQEVLSTFARLAGRRAPAVGRRPRRRISRPADLLRRAGPLPRAGAGRRPLTDLRRDALERSARRPGRHHPRPPRLGRSHCGGSQRCPLKSMYLRQDRRASAPRRVSPPATTATPATSARPASKTWNGKSACRRCGPGCSGWRWWGLGGICGGVCRTCVLLRWPARLRWRRSSHSCQPLGKGETLKIQRWANSKTTKSANASARRQSSIPRQSSCVRPEKAAAKGRSEVRAAKTSHRAPILRLRLASMEKVPNTASSRKLPNRKTEASSPFAAR